MSGFLKQSTASQTRILGPFIDDTDFKTAETGLTIANTDIKLSKNGGTVANKNSGGGTHISNGNYAITLDATDTNTVGELEISCVVSGALQVFDKYFVVEENVYDAFYGASAAAGTDIGSILTDTGTTLNGKIDTIDGIVDTINTATAGLGGAAMRGTDSAALASVCTEARLSELDAGTAGKAANQIDIIQTDTTTDIPASISALNDVSAADVNAQCDTAISDAALATAASISALNDVSAADVNAQCDTAISDAALATAANLATVDTVVDAIKVITDALGATAAANLKLSAEHMVTGTVDTATNSHTPTTTEFQADDITEATADHYNGRIIIFTSGALKYQATSISDYTTEGGIGQFTVVAMTEAPADNDTFIIV